MLQLGGFRPCLNPPSSRVRPIPAPPPLRPLVLQAGIPVRAASLQWRPGAIAMADFLLDSRNPVTKKDPHNPG